MSTVPDDIAQVAAVVLGEQRAKLTGWQRNDAISAMAALGYSNHHIAWALHTTYNTIDNYGRRNGITLHRYDRHIDWVAIDMVVTGTARIHLTGTDRDLAILAMAPRLTAEQITHRLRISESKVTRGIAKRLGITLREPEQWSWQAYMSTGSGVHNGRRRQAVAAA